MGTLLFMNSFNYSIWLVPCAEQREVLKQTIDSLAARFQTPPFAPHVTLCSGVWRKEEAELAGQVDRVAAELPVTMAADEIGWTDQWATFFFLRLSGAKGFFKRAGSLVEGSHPPPVGPHLSLLYGVDAPQIERPALRQELSGRLPETVCFDKLALVRPATRRWEDVESWEIVHSSRLSG
jgi:hypothetical protein